MITVRNHYADMHDIVLTRLRSATVVAILFLTELDNAAYFFLLGEEIRARVEAKARVVLSVAESTQLVRSKAVHFAVVVVAINAVVFILGISGDSLNAAGAVVPHVLFWLGGLVEARARSVADGSSFGQAACRTTLSFVLALATLMLGVNLYIFSRIIGNRSYSSGDDTYEMNEHGCVGGC
jgi:hypothetical protein